MSRLPIIQSDVDVWGDVLNDYLTVEHDADGTHTTTALTTALDARYAHPRSGKTATTASSLPWIDVKDHGATGNGTTNDTTAIQAAINAAVALATTTGNRVRVLFPAGIYLANGSTSASGLTFALYLVGDRVTLEGEAGAVLKRTSATGSILFIAGCGKPEGIATWLKYAPWRYTGDTFASGSAITPACPHALLPITGGTHGAFTVTLTTPASASSLAVGDIVVVRSGQVVDDAGNWNAEPDSEYNVVKAADAGTGVVTLERPLCKDYVQEYQSAVGITSSPTFAAVTVPLGIVQITDSVIKDISLRRLRFESLVSATAPLQVRGVVDGWVEEDTEYDCLGTSHDTMEYRNAKFRNVTATMRGTHREDFWPVAVAVGCSDVSIENVTGIATEKSAVLHIHEGSSRVRARGVTLISGTQAGATTPEISIRARAYDVRVDDYLIAGANQTNAIIIASTCTGGGVIGRGSIRKPNMAGRGILCQAPNWYVELPADGAGGDIQIDPGVRSTGLSLPVRLISTWVSDDAQTAALGVMPAQSVVISCGVHVYEAFNSDGTDQIHIGHDANNTSFVAGVDVSSTLNKTVAVTAGMGYRDTGVTVKAYYVNGGSEPITGKALVWMLIATVPTHVA